MAEKVNEKVSEAINKSPEELSSKDVANAHAAGDGASGRSKEAITEEDIDLKKKKDEPKKGTAESY